jgi:hypothetical protein
MPTPDLPASHTQLLERYGLNHPITDADVRVVVTVRPATFAPVTGGYTAREVAAASDAT